MKKLLFLIFLILEILFLGCIAEKPKTSTPIETKTPIPETTESPRMSELGDNLTEEIESLEKEMKELESIIGELEKLEEVNFD
ncbi:MAG: hypothetical protein QXW74_05885 [Archaeoglobaceae archaeon]